MKALIERNKTVFSCLFWVAVSAAAAVLLMLCGKRAYHGFNPKPMLVLLALVLISMLMHIRNSLSSDDTVTAALGLKTSASYDVRYDYIRLFAVFGVILMHSMDAAMPFLSSEINEETLAVINSVPKAELYPAAVLRTFMFLGNTSFLMLTGTLTFGRGTDESFFNFYRHFFSKIVLPFIIYFIFYLWQNRKLTPFSFQTIEYIVWRITSGSIDPDAPFMWLIYMTISIYIAIPFLRYMFKAMSYRALSVFAGVIFVCFTLRIYCSVTTDILPFFSGWIGVSVLGYWVSRPETRRYDRLIWLAAVCAAVRVATAVNPYVYWQQYINYYVHFAPLSLFMACGIFALALHRPARRNIFTPLVSVLGRNSYTILLLHWWALYHVVRSSLERSMSWEDPMGFVISVVLVIIIALIAGFLIDQTVVYVARAAFDGIMGIISGITARIRTNISASKV